ncbi:sugar transferase [Microbacterium luticocti]|uniref:sugar transferase n=1 Tax=Microbacterium luticocti TaxID=451764 RepID=UPI00056757E9|nr:sugar transferase [Microbacterium luticocti]
MSSAALDLNGSSAAGAPRTMPLLAQRLTRERRHRVGMGATDAVVIACAAGAAAFVSTTDPAAMPPDGRLVAAVLACAAWWGALVLLRGRAHRRGAGERFETVPIVHATIIGIAVLAVAQQFTPEPLLRPHLLVTVPVGVALLLATRAVRVLVEHTRQDAALAPRALVTGPAGCVADTVRALHADARFAFKIVGVAVDGAGAELVVDGHRLAVLGGTGAVADLARRLSVDTVIVAGGIDDAERLRRLRWSLEGAAADLVLATRLADVDRKRIDFDRTHSLALTHVALPTYDRSTRRAKRVLDVVVAAIALVPVALLTPVIALCITLDSPGGVFFRQKRIGRDGVAFDILKFRTMTADAERDRTRLLERNEGAGPLFKLRDDPRITRVGAVLRRFSLDELPQFWNVLRGDMSVVGPRPPLPDEVAAYDPDVFRRLYVQPGITGLWQISGRSDLSWEQSVRLDLQYVENWSLATDLTIIARTAAAMVRPRGAY